MLPIAVAGGNGSDTGKALMRGLNIRPGYFARVEATLLTGWWVVMLTLSVLVSGCGGSSLAGPAAPQEPAAEEVEPGTDSAPAPLTRLQPEPPISGKPYLRVETGMQITQAKWGYQQLPMRDMQGQPFEVLTTAASRKSVNKIDCKLENQRKR